MELIERHAVSRDWVTLTLVLAFFLLVGLKYFFPHRFENFIRLFYTNRYFKANEKSPKLIDSFGVGLDVLNIISVSLFIYIAFVSFSLVEIVDPAMVFIQIMLGYVLFFSVKYFLEKITATVFSMEKFIDTYLFYKISYRNFIALCLLPFVVFFIYGFQPSSTFMIGFLVVVAIANILALLKFYRKNQNRLLPLWFYFILYLCAFEIAPYFILYKVIVSA